MKIRIVSVPYDSGLFEQRMGRGPSTLLHSGLLESLRNAGHEVEVAVVRTASTPATEINAAFELNVALARVVQEAVEAGAFPIVLAGNCNSAIGTVAGLRDEMLSVVWFDSHADFNTPETTISGFLDGMALATLTGHCWRSLAQRVPGFRPIREHRVALVGVRAIDPLEEELLRASAIRTVPVSAMRRDNDYRTLDSILAMSAEPLTRLYIHIDLDVLEPTFARANQFAAPEGPSLSEVAATLRFLVDRYPIAALAVTAYDPAFDEEHGVQDAAIQFISIVAGGIKSPKLASGR